MPFENGHTRSLSPVRRLRFLRDTARPRISFHHLRIESLRRCMLPPMQRPARALSLAHTSKDPSYFNTFLSLKELQLWSIDSMDRRKERGFVSLNSINGRAHCKSLLQSCPLVLLLLLSRSRTLLPWCSLQLARRLTSRRTRPYRRTTVQDGS